MSSNNITNVTSTNAQETVNCQLAPGKRNNQKWQTAQSGGNSDSRLDGMAKITRVTSLLPWLINDMTL